MMHDVPSRLAYTSSRTSVALGIRLDDVTLDVFPLALGFWERREMNDNHPRIATLAEQVLWG